MHALRTIGRSHLALAVILFAGCASYRFGVDTLYRPDLRTIHVPVFASDSLRRGLGERLTEAVVKQIEARTPYKVVDELAADSVLQGRIVTDLKSVVTENVNDEPRELDVRLIAQVTWLDRRGNLLVPATNIPLTPVLQDLGKQSAFVPEAGQSISTAQLIAISKLADQIVSQLETRW